MRVRGLKPDFVSHPELSENVAPRAGAWIETDNALTGIGAGVVAPRAGAWIETDSR